MKRICVIGSLNMDLVANVERFPKPGETIVGKEFATYPGGKGANQAVALGRLGADVLMVGKVGDDLYGGQYIRSLEQEGVALEGIGIEEGTSSGIAVIEVDNTGENNIVIIPGANGRVSPDFIDKNLDLIREYDIFLFQLEIPFETVCYAIGLLNELGKTVILDPAPARALPDELYPLIDYITPNETEIEILTGISIQNEEDLKRAGDVLLRKGVMNIISKAGRNGAYLINKNGLAHVGGYRVEAVDTTAAGDSFNAGFAFALAQGRDVKDCIQFANAVGALSTTAIGAQSAMPTFTQVESFVKNII